MIKLHIIANSFSMQRVFLYCETFGTQNCIVVNTLML